MGVDRQRSETLRHWWIVKVPPVSSSIVMVPGPRARPAKLPIDFLDLREALQVRVAQIPARSVLDRWKTATPISKYS